jgi:Xaa-Pro aminopeptidase
LRDAHAAAVRVLAQGMLDVGLLDRNVVGDLDAVIESAAYRRFYMHGTGHWLGRDVHDVGDYQSPDEAPVAQPDWLGGSVVKKPSRKLEPGMVVTIEPGIYVRPGEGVPERFWNIGIRIEDDAVVTATGCDLISRGAPVAAGDIEALMRT